MCLITHSYVYHRSCVCHDSLISAEVFVHVRDNSLMCVCYDSCLRNFSFMRVMVLTWCFYTCAMSPLRVCYDASIRVL